MPNWSGGILTTKGQALQAKVDAGQTLLTLTKMKIGSGVLPTGQTLQGLNDLVVPEIIVPISAVSAEGNITTITGVITNAGLADGFNVRELGVFAQDPTLGEILYSITTDSAPDYFPPEGGSVTVSSEFSYHIAVNNASSVTAVLDSSGLVTVSMLQQHKHDGTAANGPKLTANNIVNSLLTGLSTTDVQSTLAAIFKEATKKSGSVRNAVITGPVSTSGMANVLRDRYSGNLCVGGTAISGGDLVGYPKEGAFDRDLNTVWKSVQLYTGVNGVSYIGYVFSIPKIIRRVLISQIDLPADCVSSVKIQNSTDGEVWNTVATKNTFPGKNILYLDESTACRYWRVLANSGVPTSNYSWNVREVQMHELLNTELTDSDILIQANALVSFAAGFDLINKQPLDYWVLTQQQMSLTLAAADAYTVPLSYTDDVCNGGTAISGGDYVSSYASLAFDNIWDSTHQWQSAQNAANQLGVSYIGYNFGVAKAIRKIRIVNLSTVANIMSSLKAQYSNNGTVWVDAGTVTISPVSSQDTIVTIPAVGAYQYWRLLANANIVSGTTWAVLDIEMYEALQTHYVYLTRDANGNITVGKSRNKPRTVKPISVNNTVPQGYYTANLCVGGTPISGGDAAANTSKAQAFDNNTDTFWISSQTGAAVNGVAWVGYNFGSPKVIRKVVLSMPAPNYIADSIKIQASTNGDIWIDQLTVNGLSAGGGGGLYTALIPPNAGYSYWRVLANANTVTGYGMAAHEIYMMEYVEPITSTTQADDTTYSDNLCISGAAISGGDYAAINSKEMAFDGNSSIPWASSQTTSNQLGVAYLGYDFGVSRSIRRLTITTASTKIMPSVKVQRSTDNSTWTDVLTASLTGVDTISLPTSTPSRYWRVLANANIASAWDIHEMTMHEVSNDINLYDPLAGLSKHYDGSTWDNVVRVFIGEAVVDSAGNIVSYTTYPYNKAHLKALPAAASDDVVTLGQFLGLLARNGYIEIPVNDFPFPLILQWGLDSVSANTSSSPEIKSLNILFPNQCFIIVANVGATGLGTVGASIYTTSQYRVSKLAH
jgi:hypothetical protein